MKKQYLPWAERVRIEEEIRRERIEHNNNEHVPMVSFNFIKKIIAFLKRKKK